MLVSEVFSIAEKKQRADLFQECENVQLRDICGRAALSASFSRDYKDTDYMSLSDCSLHIYISCTESYISRDYKDTDYMSLSDCSLHIYIFCTELYMHSIMTL